MKDFIIFGKIFNEWLTIKKLIKYTIEFKSRSFSTRQVSHEGQLISKEKNDIKKIFTNEVLKMRKSINIHLMIIAIIL